MRVVGLGTQDSAQQAADFVTDLGTVSFPVYWDETFESWQAFGVTAQPAAALFDASGESIAGWRGMFPEDEVLDLVAAAGA